MAKMRFGIIGCGEIAVRTAEAIAQSESATVVATMDVNEGLAKDLAERHNVRYSTDLDELLSWDDVDAVYISTPHHLHAPQAIRSAEAKKHIVVEKPMALNVAEAKEMIEACKSNGVVLSVCFPMRYLPHIRKAKELLSKGTIGRVVGISIKVLIDKPASYWTGGYTGRAKTDWRMHKETAGGGILIMNAIHNIDWMRYLTGLEVERVYAEYGTLVTEGIDVEDVACVVLRYANGAVGMIEALSCAAGSYGPGQWSGDRIYGTHGTIVLTEPLRLYTKVGDLGYPTNQWIEVPSREMERNDRKLFIDDFVRSVSEGKEPLVSAYDGLVSVAIIEAAYISLECGSPVDVMSLIS
ncbi:MAG: Gfo/Idh/MocA family oxidoreductase [Armatimonadota bacterium]|nr:Gfo/Idh/MocA family oxidoreductase [Armatimonadota bacterium]MCX7778375.1 Gfo/Idh/MocA family oxidoreductase [Armatimonadota bacterium]MDW8026370.1 Gfo/Idh/MocA family oxidoreductase [Armatimonadota bacterium]